MAKAASQPRSRPKPRNPTSAIAKAIGILSRISSSSAAKPMSDSTMPASGQTRRPRRNNGQSISRALARSNNALTPVETAMR